jgi:uncharacterized membrane protein HdeD (DUF308 family)
MPSYAVPIEGAADGPAPNRWVLGLRGGLAILFGLFTLAFPGATMLSFVLVFPIYALCDGVVTIAASIRAVRRKEPWSLLLLEGIVDLLAAAVSFLLPGLTVIAFVGVLAGWAIASGILRLVAAFDIGAGQGRGWLVFGGMAAILYGTLLIIAPLTGAVILTWWLGVYAIVIGASLIGLAVTLGRAAP